MADFETALRARLMASPDVVALAGTRIDWNLNLPSYPAVRMTVVSDRRDRHMTGPNRYRPVRVQIDVMATDAVRKGMLREAVLAAIEAPGTFGGVRCGSPGAVTVRDLGEADGKNYLHRDAIDLVIWTDG